MQADTCPAVVCAFAAAVTDSIAPASSRVLMELFIGIRAPIRFPGET
jgi:hypothetical protein